MGIIETISIKHIDTCISISNELLGVNYHDKIYFENAIQNKQGIVLIEDNRTVGFLIFKVTSPGNSNKMYGLDLNESVGHIGSVCVVSSHQRRGFANQLVQKAISILKKDFSSIYTLAWEYNGIVNLKKILIKNNFKELNYLDSIWKEECENNDFNCPVKENRCICSGIVYCLNTK